LFDKIQVSGDYIGSVSFRKELEETTAFQKMVGFIEENLQINEQFQYQTIEDDFYESIDGYAMAAHQDHFSLGKTNGLNYNFDSEKLLNEQMYILQKQD